MLLLEKILLFNGLYVLLLLFQYVYIVSHVFIVEDELDFSKLNLEGETFESEADAYEVFNDYAYRMGFSVRKSKTR